MCAGTKADKSVREDDAQRAANAEQARQSRLAAQRQAELDRIAAARQAEAQLQQAELQRLQQAQADTEAKQRQNAAQLSAERDAQQKQLIGQRAATQAVAQSMRVLASQNVPSAAPAAQLSRPAARGRGRTAAVTGNLQIGSSGRAPGAGLNIGG